MSQERRRHHQLYTPMQTLDGYEIDNDDNIIAMGDIPQQPPHTPLIVNNTNNNHIPGRDNDNKDAESNNINGSGNNDDNLLGKDNDDKPADLVTATNVDNNKSGSNQGVPRLKRRGKGVTKKYANYSLLMATRQAKRGGHVGLSFAMGVSSFLQTI
jgi:hypothetical protein